MQFQNGCKTEERRVENQETLAKSCCIQSHTGYDLSLQADFRGACQAWFAIEFPPCQRCGGPACLVLYHARIHNQEVLLLLPLVDSGILADGHPPAPYTASLVMACGHIDRPYGGAIAMIIPEEEDICQPRSQISKTAPAGVKYTIIHSLAFIIGPFSEDGWAPAAPVDIKICMLSELGVLPAMKISHMRLPHLPPQQLKLARPPPLWILPSSNLTSQSCFRTLQSPILQSTTRLQQSATRPNSKQR
jgi:hypothetical protein